MTDPDDMAWLTEMSVAGAPFTLLEEYHCTPSLRDVDLVLARGEMVALRARGCEKTTLPSRPAIWTQGTSR